MSLKILSYNAETKHETQEQNGIMEALKNASEHLNTDYKIPPSSHKSAFTAYRQLRDYLSRDIAINSSTLKLGELVNLYRTAQLEGNQGVNIRDKQYTLEEIALVEDMNIAKSVAHLEQQLFFAFKHSNRKLITYTIRSLNLSIDRYFEVGEKALERVIKNYNPNRKDASTFAYLAYQSIAKDVIRRAEWNIKKKLQFVSLNKKVGRYKTAELVNMIPVTSNSLLDVERMEVETCVRAAVANLKPNQREVIQMRYFENPDIQTLESVGKKIGLSKQKVKYIEASAFKRLRERLEHLL